MQSAIEPRFYLTTIKSNTTQVIPCNANGGIDLIIVALETFIKMNESFKKLFTTANLFNFAKKCTTQSSPDDEKPEMRSTKKKCILVKSAQIIHA